MNSTATSPGRTNLGITSIGQISIIAHDLPRATAFYRDVLACLFCSRPATWRSSIAAVYV